MKQIRIIPIRILRQLLLRSGSILFRSGVVKFIILFNLLNSVCSIITVAQINRGPLPNTYTPYVSSVWQPGQLVTSESVVMIERHVGNLVHQGSGFFIHTDPKLEHYCLVTASHVLFDKPVNQPVFKSKPGDQVVVDLTFGATYDNAHTNPPLISDFQTLFGRSLNVVIAEEFAELSPYRTDYALVKVPKTMVANMVFILHGVQYLPVYDLPVTRLSENETKTAYVIHHADSYPQLISTLKRSQYLRSGGPGDGANVGNYGLSLETGWSMPNWRGLTEGASGSPLVLPGITPLYNYAIGIAMGTGDHNLGNNQTRREYAFYSLAKMKDIIKANCTKEEDEEEYNQPIYVSPLKTKVKAAIPQMEELVTQVKSVEDAINQSAIKVPISETLTEELEIESGDLSERLGVLIDLGKKNYTTEEELKAGYKAVVDASGPFLNHSQEATRTEKSTVQERAILMEMFDYQNPMSCTDPRSVVHSVQILTSQLKSSFQKLGTNVGIPFVVSNAQASARVSNDANPDYLMEAPDELISLRTKVLESIKELNIKYKTLSAYQTTNKEFFKGIEQFYSHHDNYSNLYLMKHYYEDEYLVTDFIIEKMNEDLVKAQALTAPNAAMYQYKAIFAANVASIKASLAALKAKNYPQGFISNSSTTVTAAIDYGNCNSALQDCNPITKPSGQWTGLSDYGNSWYTYDKNVQYPRSIATDGTTGIRTTTDDIGIWKGTRFRVKGSVVPKQSFINFDSKFSNFIISNPNYPLALKGKFKNMYVENSFVFYYQGVFDESKLPARGTDFVPGFQHSNYVKEEKVAPLGSADVDEFVMYSPNILIYSEAYTYIVSEKSTANSTTFLSKVQQNQVKTEVQPYTALSTMRNYFEAFFRYNMTVNIGNENIGELTYSITHSDNVNARLGAENTTVTRPADQYSKPEIFPNPAKDQVRVMLPSGYEKSVFTLTDVSGKHLSIPMPIQGYERQINVGHLPTGLYFIQVKTEGKPLQVLKFLKQ